MKKIGVLIITFCFIYHNGCTQSTTSEIKVSINMNKQISTIRPLHGGNIGPVGYRSTLDFTKYFKKCKIPLIRLHDVPWFGANAVDISTIFKDFDADPSNPNNYDFRKTDDYIASIIKTGSDIIYRLGESIEYTPRKYNVNPPKDFKKWAIICKHIIMHYNEGWDNGFHYNIKYWEIWNEPNNQPRCWTGTNEQFFKLYEIAAKTLKKNFPNLKIGGPAVGAAAVIKEGKVQVYGFTDEFLHYCKENSVPLDFFSWHNYNSNPWEMARLSNYTRNILDQYGFPNTESIFDEWNYIPPPSFGGKIQQGAHRAEWYAEQSSVRGAAFIADVLMLLQDQPVDAANLYTVSYGIYALFSYMGVPHKSYYGFQAFSDLVNNTPIRLETSYNRKDSLVICTGTNKEKSKVAILVSNFSSQMRKVSFKLDNNFLVDRINYRVYAVDEIHNFSEIKNHGINGGRYIELMANIQGPSVVLLELISGKLESK